MKSFILATIAACACASLSESEAKFIEYVARFGKSYKTVEEYVERLELFTDVDSLINEHNESAQYTFTMAHNKFSDFTQAEFYKMLGRIESEYPEDQDYQAGQEYVSNDRTVPDWSVGVDWIALGAVTPVKEQICGDCWSFSSTGALEGAYAIKSGKLESFSEQQLVDCVFNVMGGCNGSLQEKAFDYYANSHYPMTEDQYKYKGKQGRCKYDNSVANKEAKVKNYTSVTKLSKDALQEALAQQPVAVSIDATCIYFRFYKHGVFDHPWCGYDLDHATLLTGYGELDGQNYFNMKNSWGESWGDHGYVKLAAVIGQGALGIQKDPLYPNLH